METYHDEPVSNLEPHDPDIDLTRIYDSEVYATRAVQALVERSSRTHAEEDKTMWEIVYMSAMNRTPMEKHLCYFRAEVDGKWESFYAEQTQGVVVISRA